jgi:hypothetical protein
VQAALSHRLLPTDRVGVQRVAAVDDDVALFEDIGQFVDDGVGRVARLHHDQGAPRLLKGSREFGHRLGAHELALGAVLVEQCVGLGDRAVVERDGVTVMREIPRDVGSHHGEAGDAI